MWVTETLLMVVAATFFVYWLKQRRRRLSLLKRNGILGPEPHLLSGNLKEYRNTPNVLWDSQLTERYESVCGYYLGAKPYIFVTDLELLEKIQSREGNNYLDRPRRVPGGINPDPRRTEMLGNLQVPQWKILRAILNKGFSPAMLQKMSADAQNLIQVFMSCIERACGAERSSAIDFYVLYQNLTLDLIGKSGFGISSDIQRNPNDALKNAVEQEFSKSTSTTLIEMYLCFPELRWLLQPLRVFVEKTKQWLGLGGHSELWELGMATLRQRKEKNTRGHTSTTPSDLLNIMMSSEKLSEQSMVANSVLFFEAGYETLSASLAFITHLLMTHLDVQDNVRNEIKGILKYTEGHIGNISQLADFKLLDAVIKEGLRMYPPQTTFIGRSGEEDMSHSYRCRDGTQKTCTIPSGVHIQVGLYQILNSSEIWDSPRSFMPQRFLRELTNQQKIAYQPFGRGRRICIGMKYANVVLKMVLIELLSKYKVIPAQQADKSDEIEVVYKTATMTPKNGVWGCVVWDPLFPANED